MNKLDKHAAPVSLADFESWARAIGHYPVIEAIERYRKFKSDSIAVIESRLRGGLKNE